MNNLFFFVLIFIFGLMIGSFLNCAICRMEEGKSFLKGRSFCPKCKHSLSWLDLFPVFSFIFLKGKCRYCKEKISIQYPIVELATGILFLAMALNSFSFFSLFFNLVISSLLVVVFVFDLKHYLIPDGAVYSGIIISFIYLLFFGLDFSILYSLLVSFGFFLVLVLISKGKWMGVGDVKFALFMGLFLGWPNVLVALMFSFILGSLVGLILIFKKRKTLSSEVPFGPFLVIGTLIAFFRAEEIISWYLGLFLIK